MKINKIVIFCFISLVTFMLPFMYVEADEDVISLEKDYKTIVDSTQKEALNENKTITSLIPDLTLTKNYYSTTDENNEMEIINIYENLNEDNTTLLLKYNILFGTINVGFNTFKNSENKTYTFYLMENNEVARGLLKINNKYYAFNKEGKMLYGWQTIDGEQYYFDLITGEASIGIKKISSGQYYFSSTGTQTIGLIYINGYYYYYYSNGTYLKNSWKTISGKQYYFNKYGVAVKGIQTINKKKYYFNTTTCVRQDGLITYGGYKWYIHKGVIYKSKWKTVGGNKYYFNSKGHAVRKGIKKIKKKYYYFNTNYQYRSGIVTHAGYKWCVKGGKIYKSKWVTYKGNKYYFNKKGHAVRNGIKKIKKKYYYFNTNYQYRSGMITHGGYKWCVKGGKIYKSKWVTYKGNKYYFNSRGHAVRNGIKTIKNKYYYFNTNYQYRAGLINHYGTYYYVTGGKKYTSTWKLISGRAYYFTSSGAAYRNKKVTISGVVYNFGDTASVTHGYYVSGENIYFADGNGKLLSGWQYVFGIKKLFSEDGIVVSTGKNVIDVSEWNGYINWSKVKASGKVNGVILKIGFTGYGSSKSLNTDSRFLANVSELKRLGIPYGIYYWGFARNATKAIQEAKYVLNLMNTHKIKPYYGVWYDAEIGGSASVYNNNWALTKSQYEAAAPAFMNTIKAAGYKAGIYSNASAFFSSYSVKYTYKNGKKVKRSTYGYLNSSKIKAYPMWVAHYNTKCSSHYSTCGYKKYNGWQYSSSGKVSGISGRVDMNFWYKT